VIWLHYTADVVNYLIESVSFLVDWGTQFMGVHKFTQVSTS